MKEFEAAEALVFPLPPEMNAADCEGAAAHRQNMLRRHSTQNMGMMLEATVSMMLSNSSDSISCMDCASRNFSVQQQLVS